jgi:hypothetical protein
MEKWAKSNVVHVALLLGAVAQITIPGASKKLKTLTLINPSVTEEIRGHVIFKHEIRQRLKV